MYAECMKVSTRDDLDYCKDLIKKHDHARIMQCMFLPEGERHSAFAYYALKAELEHIHDHVSQEMIGHIRYAFWAESVEQLPANPRSHPVIRALADSGIASETLSQLVENYREAYPDLPKDPPELVLEHKKWNKAGEIIRRHKGGPLLLIIKLLFV